MTVSVGSIGQPALERVAEILVGPDGGGCVFGSGYLLGERLVLTARHLLDDAPADSRVSVRLGGRPALHSAEPVWRSATPETDLALVRLTGPSAPGGASPPPVLGRLDADPARTVPVTATGFPALAGLVGADRVTVRDSYQVTAEVATHSYVKTGRLELRGHARSDATGARWRGLSGGAVFAEDTLIGVVVSAAGDAPVLHATPLSAVATDPHLRSLLLADGVEPDLRPVRRTAAYTRRVRRLARQVGELQDREAELAEIASFARSHPWWYSRGVLDLGPRQWRSDRERSDDDLPSAPPHASYRWITGPPWAGKTALAAHFAAFPPPDVDVVSFFVSRSFGEQTRQYQQEVCDQLAALLGDPPQTFFGQGTLDSLWQRANDRAAFHGRNLLLLVDGLDENDESPPIAALLPTETGDTGHVLVLSRAMPPIPAAVPRDHPLRDEERCPRVPLSPTRRADQLRERATDELTTLLPDREVRAVLGTLAVGGPMTLDDLGAVLETAGGAPDPYDLRTLVRSVPARVLSSVAGGDGGAEGTAERFGFAHDELRRATLTEIGAAAARHRTALHTWADGYARRAWPDDTPDYLVAHYPAVLLASSDTARLTDLPSPERVAMWQRRTGHDTDAAREITDALRALAESEGDGLRAAAVLAMRRYRLFEVPADPSFGFPAAIPIGWAEQGQWARADYLASVIWSSARAYAGIALVAARLGERERFHGLAQRAWEAARRSPAGAVWDAPQLAAVGRAAFGLDAPELGRQLLLSAEESLRTDGEDRGNLKAKALAETAGECAAVGERDAALALIGMAEELVRDERSVSFAQRGDVVFQSALVRGLDGALAAFPVPREGTEQVRVRAWFARAAGRLGDAAGCLRALMGAEAALRGLDPDAYLLVVPDVAEAAARTGHDGTARRLAEEAVARMPSATGPGDRDRARVWLAPLYELLGEPDRADALTDETGEVRYRLAALSACAEAAYERGDAERAGRLLDRAERLPGVDSPAGGQSDPRRELAAVNARCGRPERAERILRALTVPGRHFWERLALAEAVGRTGRLDQSERVLALADGDGDWAQRAAAALAVGAARAGDLDRVRTLAAFSDSAHRGLLLRLAAVGAAEGGHFDLTARLIGLAREAVPASGRAVHRGREDDPVATAAFLAVRAGEPGWAEHFARLVRPLGVPWPPSGPAIVLAVRWDFDGARRRALGMSMPPDQAEALAIVAEIAAVRGHGTLADELFDLAGQAVERWAAANYARSRAWSHLAVAAARMGRLGQVRGLLRRMYAAHPDHRVPVLAALAEALARQGEHAKAVASLDEAFTCYTSRQGGADEEKALAALVTAGTAVDPARSRRQVVRLLADRQRTPTLLPAVLLADPELAPLAIDLLGGSPDPDGAPGDVS
ncbi:trypsin-like peptidase domain-containing protein [Streptomyces sp. SBC-4]|nr:trypsin-like peptidase domain-containing protein [Streptomyces sp. SBC-4]MDV5148544.1 trypsin-like peptidase domain-containing protein [Streptomyces sp. SBC-4]